MMFITLVLSSILVALIVLVLKRHQQQRHNDLAEREQTLPPLDIAADYLSDDVLPDNVSPDTTIDPMPLAPAPELELELEPEAPALTVAEPLLENVTELTYNSPTNESPAKEWREDCKEHRLAQRYEMAILCAEQAWPQLQSYEQTALTIRAAIKQARHESSPDTEKWLQALYRTGVESSLLHDKLPDEPELRWQTIARSHSRHDIQQIALPWNKIGVNELKLLTKTDRKLMIQAWGEPEQHTSAKAYFKLTTPAQKSP